jgi:hypothetical protein
MISISTLLQKFGRDWRYVNEQRTFDMESFCLKKLNNVEGKEQRQTKISDTFVDFEH